MEKNKIKKAAKELKEKISKVTGMENYDSDLIVPTAKLTVLLAKQLLIITERVKELQGITMGQRM